MSALIGKVAVTMGGNSGVGLATAKRFVEEGAYVFITGRRQAELDKAVALIGKQVTTVQGDITKSDDFDRVVAAVQAEKGRVAIIVSNAGITEQGAIDSFTPEYFDKVFNLNARARVFLVQKFLPLMISKGSIILAGSAIQSVPGHTAYAAKAALHSYARTWAAEFKGRGIRVNTLSPGVTDTPMLADQSAGLCPRNKTYA